MSVLVHRNLRLLVVFGAFLVIIAPSVSCSCLFSRYANDPSAKTPGYKLFTGRTEGLAVSFEYPETWRRRSIEKHDAFETFYVKSDNSSFIDMSSDMNASKGGELENAHAWLQYSLDIDSVFPEFQILSRGTVLLGNVEGEEVSYSFRFRAEKIPEAPPGYVVDKIVIVRRLAADYAGRIYRITLSTDADKYDGDKEYLEHFVATFQFFE